MAGEWNEIRAKDFCTSVRDGTHDSPKSVKVGRRLVTSRHITGRKLDLSNAYLISQEDFDEINRRSKVDRWDVLISMIGTVGEPCLITEEPDFAIKNIGLFKSRGEAEGKYLYYYLQSPQAQQYVREQSRGTTQAYIPLGALREFPFRVPGQREELQAIAHILGTLDDKIELNRRMSETLEAMARALFKSWFVDFDPVRAKAEGRDPGLPKPLADLFPVRLVDFELGEIPEGSEAGTLADVSTLNPEVWSRRTRPPKIEYVDLSNTKWGRIESTTVHESAHAPSRAQRVLRPGDTVVGTVRPGNGSYALICESGLTGSTGFAVLRPKSATLREYVYLAATRRDNIEALAHLADGGAYPAVRPEVVAATPCVVPSDSILSAFSQLAGSFLRRIANNEKASRTLAALRDTLLPKLISGELRIGDAAARCQEARGTMESQL